MNCVRNCNENLGIYRRWYSKDEQKGIAPFVIVESEDQPLELRKSASVVVLMPVLSFGTLIRGGSADLAATIVAVSSPEQVVTACAFIDLNYHEDGVCSIDASKIGARRFPCSDS
ncbi:hypothetical protein L1987_09577 [Smallanthus sonchifolius]|uniref:Uncharacterized protein n=1 Tax=Smallanthus sonchifolius TaxID=185202 RepID=A0ACB9JPP2_9ASTR|nr:hypothetical protein L1987_09577 [Smallanthus sonchifolius]